MWDNTEALSLIKGEIFQFLFCFCANTEIQREKCVQQDSSARLSQIFFNPKTLLGMHSFKVECWKYILLTIHDSSDVLI